MNAEIITIGDEILIGQVTDSNSAFIGQELTKIGIEVNQITTIPDNSQQILKTLKNASERADLVLLTGGLGPTKDDITKLTFCNYFEDTLVENEAVLENIKTLFTKIEEPVYKENLNQAKIPSKAIALNNKYGTAPGMWMEKDKVVYISLPGVPYEMKALVTDEVIPRLVKKFKRPYILSKTVLTYGMGESRVMHKIENWENALPNNFSLAYLPAPGRVRIRITARGENKEELEKEMNSQLKTLHGLIGDIIGGLEQESSLQEELAKILVNSGKTLATAESFTGGKIANLFTEIPGASNYFKGALVPYDTSIKIDVLGVPSEIIEEYSVVSANTAKSMAQQAQKLFKSDFAIATTGNAGPTKGDSNAPIGTAYIAIAHGDKVDVKVFHLGNNREKIVQKGVYSALTMLKTHLS